MRRPSPTGSGAAISSAFEPAPGRPLIGVTTYHREVDGRPRFSLPAAYVDAVRDAGALAVLVAPGEAAPAALLERLDGLVFSGGGDLSPEFGAPAHADTYFTCAERDAFEVALIRAAVDRALPTLAICRGMQILNAAYGGTLHAHLPDFFGETVVHRASRDAAVTHPIQIAADARLAALLETATIEEPSSWHHQAVDRIGEGLRPVAWAEDGVVEALELGGDRPLIAVQWHPELDTPRSPGRGVFDALVEWAQGPQTGQAGASAGPRGRFVSTPSNASRQRE